MGVAWYRPGSTRKDWVQRRRQPRKSIVLSANARGVKDGTALASCQVLDISEGGARLKLDCPGDVPDSFVLVLYGQTFRYCEVRWRSASEVGVQFKRGRE
jgi:PilZ domain-containing protein